MYGLSTQGQSQFNAGVACASISSVAVAIRIFCKIRHKQGVHADDYWIIVALAFYLATVGVVIWGQITGGGGIEMKDLLIQVAKNPKKLHLVENFLESMFIGFTLVTTAIFAVKISILCFYHRIFFITKGYRYASIALMAFATLWFIGTQIGNLLLCQPIDSFWHRTKPGKCLNFNLLFLATGIIDTLTDVAILILPVRMAFKLQLPIRTKVAVAGIFALGGFVIITNIIRIKFIYQPGAKYVNFGNAERWSHIHMVTAFVCACLPIYKPLWGSISSATGNIINRYASSFRSLLGPGSGNKSKDTSYLRMGNLPGKTTDSVRSSETQDLERGYMSSADKNRGKTSISVIGGMNDDHVPLSVPQGSISYQRKVDVF